MELKNYKKALCAIYHLIWIVQIKLPIYLLHGRSIGVAKTLASDLAGVPTYNNAIKGVPHVCMKVPTGGGKTFMACASVKRIFDEMPKDKPKVVVWLVPSDPILNQTIKNLSNINHPYRQKLESDFAGRVGVYTKEQLLSGHNFSPDTVTVTEFLLLFQQFPFASNLINLNIDLFVFEPQQQIVL